MKSDRNILDRYEKEDGKYIIQISTNNFRDLFNKFDRTSSFIIRDLDYDFAEYLYESVSDLVKRDFCICLNLYQEKQSIELESKVNKGIDNYFEYEIHKNEIKKQSVVRNIFVHVFLSLICFFLSYTLSKIINVDSLMYVLFVESIVIAAWVLMWPVFSDFIYELHENKKTTEIYKRLIDADLKFNYLS